MYHSLSIFLVVHTCHGRSWCVLATAMSQALTEELTMRPFDLPNATHKMTCSRSFPHAPFCEHQIRQLLEGTTAHLLEPGALLHPGRQDYGPERRAIQGPYGAIRDRLPINPPHAISFLHGRFARQLQPFAMRSQRQQMLTRLSAGTGIRGHRLHHTRSLRDPAHQSNSATGCQGCLTIP